MKIEDVRWAGFGIANYRGFDAQGGVLEGFGRTNVLIGKNNSGKSNVIRFLRWYAAGENGAPRADPVADSHRRTQLPPTFVSLWDAEAVLQEEYAVGLYTAKFGHTIRVEQELPNGAVRGFPAHQVLGQQPLHRVWERLVTDRNWSRVPSAEHLGTEIATMLARGARDRLNTLLKDYIVIPDFRQILHVPDAKPDSHVVSGENIILQLHRMQHPQAGKEDEKETFDKIEQFVRDLLGEPDLRMEIVWDQQAILLNLHGNRLPLSSFGTGIHQLVILCAAFAMYRNRLILMEEPEIHLHPGLQRQLLRFMATQTDNRYLLTTHSNVFLDFYADTSVYHITYDGVRSRVEKADTGARARQVVTDLGYKASDLLQSNCVIWVEGPSDRIFINRWLELVGASLVESLHYSIMLYGGKCLSHLIHVPADCV